MMERVAQAERDTPVPHTRARICVRFSARKVAHFGRSLSKWVTLNKRWTKFVMQVVAHFQVASFAHRAATEWHSLCSQSAASLHNDVTRLPTTMALVFKKAGQPQTCHFKTE